MPVASFALTALPFAPVREPLTNQIAQLSSIENPTFQERVVLRRLLGANSVLSKASFGDGKALRILRVKLNRFPEYAGPLDLVASNLVVVFTNEHQFVESLLNEVPPSRMATRLTNDFARLTRLMTNLTDDVNAQRTGARYDFFKRRLDRILKRANELLLIRFPYELEENQIKAFINGTAFTTSATAASENLFKAVRTETNIVIAVSAIDFPRGMLFSIPNVQPDVMHYSIPNAVIFTNRAGVYTAHEMAVGATSGSFAVGTNITEVYGNFQARGPGFNIIAGRFRITLTQ